MASLPVSCGMGTRGTDENHSTAYLMSFNEGQFNNIFVERAYYGKYW
jgi:hypothetical protein